MKILLLSTGISMIIFLGCAKAPTKVEYVNVYKDVYVPVKCNVAMPPKTVLPAEGLTAKDLPHIVLDIIDENRILRIRLQECIE